MNPTLHHKVNAIKRVMFWTTAINIALVIAIVIAAYAFLSSK